MQSEQATHAMHRVQRRHPIVNTERRIAALKNVSTLPATAALAKVPVLRMTAALKPVAALPATAADPRVNAEPATADEYEVAADPATAVERRVATLQPVAHQRVVVVARDHHERPPGQALAEQLEDAFGAPKHAPYVAVAELQRVAEQNQPIDALQRV